MPIIGGLELARLAKSKQPTPILIISGYPNIGHKSALAELGADDFLDVPIDALLGNNGIPQKVKEIIKYHHNNENETHPLDTSQADKIVKRGIAILDVADFLAYATLKNPIYPMREFKDAISLLMIKQSDDVSTQIINVLNRAQRKL